MVCGPSVCDHTTTHHGSALLRCLVCGVERKSSETTTTETTAPPTPAGISQQLMCKEIKRCQADRRPHAMHRLEARSSPALRSGISVFWHAMACGQPGPVHFFPPESFQGLARMGADGIGARLNPGGRICPDRLLAPSRARRSDAHTLGVSIELPLGPLPLQGGAGWPGEQPTRQRAGQNRAVARPGNWSPHCLQRWGTGSRPAGWLWFRRSPAGMGSRIVWNYGFRGLARPGRPLCHFRFLKVVDLREPRRARSRGSGGEHAEEPGELVGGVAGGGVVAGPVPLQPVIGRAGRERP